jgi:hypothetical protein
MVSFKPLLIALNNTDQAEKYSKIRSIVSETSLTTQIDLHRIWDP